VTTPEQLKRFGTRFFELGGGDPRELLEESIEALGRFNYGYFQLFRKFLVILIWINYISALKIDTIHQ